MKELKLSLTDRINLRTSEHIQYSTTEHLTDGEQVLVDKVGLCEAMPIVTGLFKLTITQNQWMHTKEGGLVKIPPWALIWKWGEKENER